LNKITKTFLYFLVVLCLCVAQTSCRSSSSAYNQRKSATTGKGYVKKKAKSGNKRANRGQSNRSRVASRSSAPSKPVYGKRPPSTGASAEVRESKAASVQAQEVIKTARSYIGTPYRYGGSTRRGMDCSGLLCASFEAANIKLPRTSNEQAGFGAEVRLAHLSPGDLVFFAENKGSNRISHVGLVTEVNGRNEVKFIHSSTSRGVIEDNFYSDYYQKIFVKAVRPF
jgi:cell wall-associated NlpC family hydrolase